MNRRSQSLIEKLNLPLVVEEIFNEDIEIEYFEYDEGEQRDTTEEVVNGLKMYEGKRDTTEEAVIGLKMYEGKTYYVYQDDRKTGLIFQVTEMNDEIDVARDSNGDPIILGTWNYELEKPELYDYLSFFLLHNFFMDQKNLIFHVDIVVDVIFSVNVSCRIITANINGANYYSSRHNRSNRYSRCCE
jgi:hypothetical protein